MPTRIKQTSTTEVPVPQSLEEADAIVRRIVKLQLEREKTVADRDSAVERLAANYNKEIAHADLNITACVEAVRMWSLANRKEFGGDRSLVLSGHRIGWRLGNWHAATLPRWTWAKVQAAIKEAGQTFSNRFLRVKEEIDKEALVASRTEVDTLAKIGVRIVQGETFYIQPDRQGQEGPLITA